jgi:beta-N-acetylhexosaminidase
VVGIGGAVSADDPEAVRVTELGVRGIILKTANLHTLEQAQQLVAGLRSRSPDGLVVAVDEEGGRVSHAARLVPRQPSARILGGRGPEAAQTAGLATGQALAAAGIDLDLAPVADLDGGPARSVIGDRSFGANPEAAAAGAVAFLRGLHEAGVAAAAKHFPGYAGAGDTHAEQAVSTIEVLDPHLHTFRELIRAGVDAVMVGHVTYTSLGPQPASLNPAVYALLRREGFDGPAITDSLGMGAVQAGGFAGAAVEALAAGADVLLANQGADAAVEMRDAIVTAVQDGRLSRERLVEASARAGRLVEGASTPC